MSAAGCAGFVRCRYAEIGESGMLPSMQSAGPTSAGGDLMEVAISTLSACLGRPPETAIVLGSGLDSFAAGLPVEATISYRDLPGFLPSTVPGHAAELAVLELQGERVAVMRGRLHLYEGFSASQIVFPVRALARWGVKRFFLSNAAGAVNREMAPGELMLVVDHLNLLGENPLAGPGDEHRFIDMSDAYSPRLLEIASEAAARLGIRLRRGVYAAVKGPSFETPAEVRMLRTLGADAVGMSTVPEVIALRSLDREVLAVSCISNMAAGIDSRPISHEEVLAAGISASEKMRLLLLGILENLNAEEQGANETD